MPFTISHTAAVWPFSRWLRRSHLLSAAVIGSMVPDFGLFLPLVHLSRLDTHTVRALATFCLPMGLAAYWLFQGLIKTAVLEILPPRAYARSRPFAAPADIRSPKAWLVAAAGILGGAVTHLIWDGFTHEGARGMRMLPALDDLMLEFGGHHLTGPHLMQDVSSLIGLALVFLWLWRALVAGPAPAPQARRLAPAERGAWMAAYALTALVVSGVAFAIARATEAYTPSLTAAASDAAVAAVRGLAAALLAVSMALDLRLRRRSAP
jgi:hypothetical protein